MRMSSTALIDLCFRHSAGPGAQVWRHSATIYDHVHVAMWVSHDPSTPEHVIAKALSSIDRPESIVTAGLLVAFT